MKPTRLRSGAVMQGGIRGSMGPGNPASYLMRGVVTATYVVDDPNYPFVDNSDATPVGVYCDVLAYGAISGSRWQFFPSVLVSQDVGGMQRGTIWKPRATTMDVTGNALDPNQTTNPADMDGDHVLIGFIDNSLSSPVILRGIPHPSTDQGYTSASPAGARQKLVLADGDPYFVKHHGSFYGISDTGDLVADTSRATNGHLLSDGSDPAPPTDGSLGNQLYVLEQHSKRMLSLMDMSTPTSPQAVLTELLNMTNYVLDFLNLTPVWKLLNSSGNALTVQDVGADATLVLGDGSQHVAVAENLATWWNSTVKPKLDLFDAHMHPTGVGPSGPPTPTIGAPTLAANVTSENMSIPTQS